jgi:hypothetical protein
MSASEWKPRARARRSKVSLTKGSTRSPSGPVTRCSKASAKSGSMPDEHPAIIEMVPVGANGGDVRVPEGAGLAIDGPREIREGAALLRQPRRLVMPLFLDEPHEALRQRERLLAVVRDAQQEEQVRPAHDAQADPAVGLHGGGDLRERVRVDLDHVVQEPYRQPDHALELVPVDVGPAAVGRLADESRDIDRPEVARVPGRQALLATGIGGLDGRELGSGIGRARVDTVQEDQPGIPRAPRRANDSLEDLARGEMARHLPVPRIHEVIVAARGQPVHEGVGHADRDIEVRHPALELALDELEDVGVIDAEHAHVCPASGVVAHESVRDISMALGHGEIDRQRFALPRSSRPDRKTDRSRGTT